MMNAITIRPLTAADEPVLWIMCYLAIHLSQGEPPPPLNILFRPEISRYMRDWGQPTDFGLGAFDGEDLPVGAAWLRLLTGEDRGYGWVDDSTPELSIALLPEYRGMGLGSQLLTGILEEARKHYPAVSLSVSYDNPAFRLYQRMGFETVDQFGESLTMRLVF